ncbi:MAG: hypothetical protein AABW81_00085 [Nanoarchaeota archaeon]
MSEKDYLPAVREKEIVRDISRKYGVKPNSLINITNKYNLTSEEITDLAILKKKYNSSDRTIMILLEKGCNMNDISLLYDLRENFGLFYAEDSNNQSPIPIVNVYNLWKSFNGDEEICEQVITHIIDEIGSSISDEKESIGNRIDKVIRVNNSLKKRGAISDLERVLNVVDGGDDVTEEEFESGVELFDRYGEAPIDRYAEY